MNSTKLKEAWEDLAQLTYSHPFHTKEQLAHTVREIFRDQEKRIEALEVLNKPAEIVEDYSNWRGEKYCEGYDPSS